MTQLSIQSIVWLQLDYLLRLVINNNNSNNNNDNNYVSSLSF